MVSGDFVRFHWLTLHTNTTHCFIFFFLKTHTSLIYLASIICFPAVSVFSANTHRTLQMVDGTHVHARTRTQVQSLFLAVSISLWNVESLSCTFFPLLALNFISFSNSILLFSEVFLLLLHLHSSQIRNTAVHKNLPYINRQKSDVYLQPCHDFFSFSVEI